MGLVFASDVDDTLVPLAVHIMDKINSSRINHRETKKFGDIRLYNLEQSLEAEREEISNILMSFSNNNDGFINLSNLDFFEGVKDTLSYIKNKTSAIYLITSRDSSMYGNEIKIITENFFKKHKVQYTEILYSSTKVEYLKQYKVNIFAEDKPDVIRNALCDKDLNDILKKIFIIKRPWNEVSEYDDVVMERHLQKAKNTDEIKRIISLYNEKKEIIEIIKNDERAIYVDSWNGNNKDDVLSHFKKFIETYKQY
ncbi:MAG: hypothetical protein QXG00_01860 [Candidatus Woesearchaeota archaeon]